MISLQFSHIFKLKKQSAWNHKYHKFPAEIRFPIIIKYQISNLRTRFYLALEQNLNADKASKTKPAPYSLHIFYQRYLSFQWAKIKWTCIFVWLREQEFE